MRVHAVDKDAAKRLPNRLTYGGDYRAWLSDNGLPERANKVRKVVLLQEELRRLRSRLFAHPRHKAYATAEHVRIAREKGKTGDALDRSILSSIITRAENQMLQVVARSFFYAGWDILALIFDGLIAAPTTGREEEPLALADALSKANEACRIIPGLQHVKLAEKPLHGLQDVPIKTIRAARAAVAAFGTSVTHSG